MSRCSYITASLAAVKWGLGLGRVAILASSILEATKAQPIEALGDRVAGALVNLRKSLRS